MPDLTGRLPNVLLEPLRRLPGVLAHLARSLTDTLADLSNLLAKPLSELPDTLADALAELPDTLTEALPYLADALPQLADRAPGPERLLAEVADVSDGIADGLDEALEYLGVAVERRQGAIEDVVKILQPHFQQRFRLDTRNVDLDLAEMHMHASHHLEEIRQLRLQREVRL